MSGGSTRDEITAILDQLRGLLGEGTPVIAPLPSTIPDNIAQRLDALPNGMGDVIEQMVARRPCSAVMPWPPSGCNSLLHTRFETTTYATTERPSTASAARETKGPTSS
jgi:hypothetical protein